MTTGWHTDDTIIVIDTLFGYICYGIYYKQIFAVALSFCSRAVIFGDSTIIIIFSMKFCIML